MKLLKETDSAIKPEEIRNQMSLISDTEEILKFLEMAASKSILNEAAVSCRLTACHNLFPILNSGEDNVSYMLQNLDLLINRFRNKNANVQASTLKVYKSRLKGTLEDFMAWSKDSLSWERSVLEKASLNKKEKKDKGTPTNVSASPLIEKAPRPTRQSRPSAHVGHGGRTAASGPTRNISFPIRPDFNVEITMPADGLTAKELLKLGLFLFPYCRDMESRDDVSWPTVGAPH